VDHVGVGEGLPPGLLQDLWREGDARIAQAILTGLEQEVLFKAGLDLLAQVEDRAVGSGRALAREDEDRRAAFCHQRRIQAALDGSYGHQLLSRVPNPKTKNAQQAR
jgi:hypothetical protein